MNVAADTPFNGKDEKEFDETMTNLASNLWAAAKCQTGEVGLKRARTASGWIGLFAAASIALAISACSGTANVGNDHNVNPAPTGTVAGSTESSSPVQVTSRVALPGNIDLTSIPKDGGAMFFENRWATIPTASFPTSVKNLTNAFLAQYAYYLYAVRPKDEMAVQTAMTDDPRVIAALETGKTERKSTLGEEAQMPEFWDTTSNPVMYTKTIDSNGNTVITKINGDLYFNNYYPYGPGHENDPAPKWQDPLGHDTAKAANPDLSWCCRG